MESRYFPEVNEEEEEPEDEGEGSPTCWWARPGSPRACSPRALPGVSWSASLPWEEAFSVGGRIQGDCAAAGKHPTSCKHMGFWRQQPGPWGGWGGCPVSLCQLTLCYHLEAGAPPGQGHCSSPWVICLGGPSTALMLLWGPRVAMEFMSCLISGLRVSTFVRM